MELNLVIASVSDSEVQASYSCPCGCRPEVTYQKGAASVHEGCCCGNQFAVGPRSASTLTTTPGFRSERESFDSPWGEWLEAAWLVGPSVHGPAAERDHHTADEGDTHDGGMAADPVCGMSVDPDVARGKGLGSRLGDRDYFFCGKGCKLEFDDDPERYLDPSYVPSM